MKIEKLTISERINPTGRNFHNPVLRWIPGEPASVHVASSLSPVDDGERETSMSEYSNPELYYSFFGGDCDEPITDSEWTSICENTIFADA